MEDFWLMNPHIFYLYADAYELKKKEQDTMNYYMYLYIVDALRVALDGFNEHPSLKPMDKTLFEKFEEEKYKQAQTRKEYDGLSKEEQEKLELEKAKAYFNSLKARFPGE